MRVLICLLILLPGLVSADKFFDGFYVTGGAFFSDTDIDFLGSGRNIGDIRPMVFAGYGRTTKMIKDTHFRMFWGLEGFYLGGSKTERGEDIITEDTGGEITTGTTTITREATQRPPIETRSYEVEQGNTWGGGIRIGITEKTRNRAGNLYGLFGYSETEVKGSGRIVDGNDRTIVSIPAQKVSFGGWYYGVGMEYAFNPHWAVRTDYLRYNYSDASFAYSSLRSKSTGIKNPGSVGLDQDGFFIGLTGRF